MNGFFQWLIDIRRRDDQRRVVESEAVRLIDVGLRCPNESGLRRVSGWMGLLAQEHAGAQKNHLIGLGYGLKTTLPVADCIDGASAVIDGETRMLLRVADRTGTLRNASADFLTRYDLWSPIEWKSGKRFSWFWLFVQGFFLVMIVTFLALFIFPTFEQMFEEFGLDLPDVSLSFLSVFRWIGDYWWLVLPPLLMGYAVAYFYFTSQLFKHVVSPRFWPRAQRRQQITILRAMANVLEGGGDLAAGWDSIAKYHPDPRLRSRFHETASAGMTPQNLATRLLEAGVVFAAEARALQTLREPEESVKSNSQDASGMVWMLRRMADAREFANQRGASLWSNINSTLRTAVMATFVLMVWLALFVPLLALIEGLAL